jgi:dipeptidyl aminopeptidase/acylaminoacyl peptidase
MHRITVDRRTVLAGMGSSIALAGGLARAAETVSGATTLVPRRVLLGNQDRTNAAISPDGDNVAFLAPYGGVQNIWVASLAEPMAARPVTNVGGDGVAGFFQWAFTNHHILYFQDSDGDENFRAFSVDLVSGRTVPLSPAGGVRAFLRHRARRFPGAMLIGHNGRDRRYADIFRVDIRTGEARLVQENPGFAGFATDSSFAVRLAFRGKENGDWEVVKPDGAGGWNAFLAVPHEDAMPFEYFGIDAKGEEAYFADPRGREMAALVAVSLATGETRVLAESPEGDVERVLVHPDSAKPEAVLIGRERPRWVGIEPAVKEEIAALEKIGAGEIQSIGRAFADRQWLVRFQQDVGPDRYYLWNRAQKTVRLLFLSSEQRAVAPLVPMKPAVIRARDGLDLVSYLTLPASAATTPPPLVLVIHGGPWGRDEWRYDGRHQWLANRGYAVLSVNYRGSTGFGKAFVNAGDREWGGRMLEDLLDAVDWATAEGYADPRRVAITGASFGGYQTLCGLTMAPERFACGVDLFGISALDTWYRDRPPYWEVYSHSWRRRMADPGNEADRAMMSERSPLSHVERIKRPLLVVHGVNDARVKKLESDQLVAAMKAKDLPVTYMVFPNEGHTLNYEANRLAYYAVMENFLAQHLGGRAEPIGDAVRRSAAQLVAGAELIPGLTE